jgi:hypothetical protein
MIKSVRPTKNWLSFPMEGSKGLATALAQTWCNDDSISFEFGWWRYCTRRATGVESWDCESLERMDGWKLMLSGFPSQHG